MMLGLGAGGGGGGGGWAAGRGWAMHCKAGHVGSGLPTAAPLASTPQDKRLASFQWSLRLQRLLPWLTSTSPTLSLPLRTSAIRQALYVAYARHDAVSGAALLLAGEVGGPTPGRHSRLQLEHQTSGG